MNISTPSRDPISNQSNSNCITDTGANPCTLGCGGGGNHDSNDDNGNGNNNSNNNNNSNENDDNDDDEDPGIDPSGIREYAFVGHDTILSKLCNN